MQQERCYFWKLGLRVSVMLQTVTQSHLILQVEYSDMILDTIR